VASEADDLAVGVALHLGMPMAVPVGVAPSKKFEAIDTWLYADGIAVGVSQTAVSLSAVTPTADG
jgi:hypothetical protein